MSRFETQFFQYLDGLKRSLNLHPLNLGGGATGSGGPPGGFTGYLPQTRVSYDITEAARNDFVAVSAYNISGVLVNASILDNLNHIRYRIVQLETSSGGSGSPLTIEEDGVVIATGVTVLDFVGAEAVETSPNHVEITITASGGGHVIAEDDTPFTQRANLNFTGAVTVTDDVGTNSTDINIITSSGYVDAFQILTNTPTIDWDLAAGHGEVVLTGIHTLADPTNIAVGNRYLKIIQDGIGSRILNYENSYLFPAGTRPILTTVVSGIDIIQFFSDGNYMYGHLFGNKFRNTYDPTNDLRGLYVWWCADDFSDQPIGTKIASWTDRKSGYLATQADTADKPQVSTPIAGHTTLYFGNSYGGMETDLDITDGPQCYFIVFKPNLDAINFSRILQGSNNWLIGVRETDHHAAYFDGSNVLLGTSLLTLGSAVVIAVKQTDTDSHVWVNGVDENNQAGEGYPGSIGFGVFDGANTGNEWASAEVAEVIISNVELGDEEMGDEMTALMDKYGIT